MLGKLEVQFCGLDGCYRVCIYVRTLEHVLVIKFQSYFLKICKITCTLTVL